MTAPERLSAAETPAIANTPVIHHDGTRQAASVALSPDRRPLDRPCATYDASRALSRANIRDYARRIRSHDRGDTIATRLALRSYADPAAVLTVLLDLPGVTAWHRDDDERTVAISRTVTALIPTDHPQ